MGCGCHIDVVASGVVVEVDVARGKVFMVVVLGWQWLWTVPMIGLWCFF